MHADFANLDPSHLPVAADPGQAERGFERWREQAERGQDAELRTWCERVADDAVGRALLTALFGNSPFLTHIAVRQQPFVRTLLETGPETALHAELAAVEHSHASGTGSTAALMADLRVLKARAALLIALADITSLWSLADVTGALSRVADLAVALAARHTLRQAHDAGRLILPRPAEPETGSGLIVLAMGKLGARGLNYSSDIDLIVLWDPDRAQAPRPDDRPRTFVRLAKELVRLLDARTVEGYVFRTDLRLRPDPGATPLAVSTEAAEVYYSSVGQNWERAALIKARAVAGDAEAAAAFLAFLKPFIWRKNLDFAAIQDIHSIKRQISAHKGHRSICVNGHDIKVGRGGIREIEFFAQTQQLIYGGRDRRLRVPDTCAALQALTEAGHLDPLACRDMRAAYGFLRRVEHRLQMIDDQQTQKLPRTDAGIVALATFLGYAGPDAFRTALLEHLGRVEDHYAKLFEAAPSLGGPGNLVFTGTDPDPGTVETLRRLGFGNPEAVIHAVATWHRGRYRATRSARARELLTELVPGILEALAGTPNPDLALLNLDVFLARLPAGVQLFSLFYANPWLLGLVAHIMGTATQLAVTLARRPALFDTVLSPGFFDALPDAAALAQDLDGRLADARDFEDVLNLLRRWKNEQNFAAGLHILRGVTDADRAAWFLTHVAELVLDRLIAAVQTEFAQRHGRIANAELAVLAMGKLGGRQFSIGSDLDLIVVYETPPGPIESDGRKPLAPSEYFTRLTKRLITALTAQTAEGTLYEVDMRLRPSGNAGPIAVSRESFVKYQTTEAWTWEHMALTRARVISGPGPLGQALDAFVRSVLTRPRDGDALLLAVDAMRAKVVKEFGTDNPWNVKYARGGVMDINFIAQYLMLRHAAQHPAVLATNTVTALERLADHGLLDQATAGDLIAAQRLWRRVQGFLRLTVEGGVIDPAALPTGIEAGLAHAVTPKIDPDSTTAVDFAAIDSIVRETGARVYGHFRRLIEDPARALAERRDQQEWRTSAT